MTQSTTFAKPTQSLGDMAMEVFLQSWYVDEHLCKIIVNERHLRERHIYLWTNEKRRCEENPEAFELYRRILIDKTSYDPSSKDGWSEDAREKIKNHDDNIGFLEQKLAAGTRYDESIKRSKIPLPGLRNKSSMKLVTAKDARAVFNGELPPLPRIIVRPSFPVTITLALFMVYCILVWAAYLYVLVRFLMMLVRFVIMPVRFVMMLF